MPTNYSLEKVRAFIGIIAPGNTFVFISFAFSKVHKPIAFPALNT